MAVTIDSTPEVVCLTKNPVVFELSTDNYVIAEGVKAARSFRYSGLAPLGGQTLQLNAPGLDAPIVWTYNPTPNTSGTQLPGAPGVAVVSWLEEVCQYMNMNPVFNQHYMAYPQSGLTVKIVALENGPDWNIALVHTGYSVTDYGGPTGVLAEYEPDYQVRARVYIHKGGNDIVVGDDEYKIPDGDGTLKWDFSETLDALFPDRFLTELSLAEATDFITPLNTGQAFFRVEFQEYYGDTPLDNVVAVSETLRLLKGGFKTYDQHESLEDSVINEDKFLTWRPEVDYCFVDSVDWLHFVNMDASESRTDLRIRWTVWFDDGTSDTNPNFWTYVLSYLGVQFANNSVYSVPCGYNQMKLDEENPDKTPIRYRIDVITNLGGLVARQEFKIIKPTKMAVNLIFTNSYGLEEGISLEGERQMEASNSFETLQLPRNLESTEADITNLDYNQLVQPRITVSTGGMSKGQAERLQELMTARRIWMVVDGKRIGCRIDETTFATGLKDFRSTNVIPNEITLLLNEEKAYSKINRTWQ